MTWLITNDMAFAKCAFWFDPWLDKVLIEDKRWKMVVYTTKITM